jgi:hypothetical protein
MNTLDKIRECAVKVLKSFPEIPGFDSLGIEFLSKGEEGALFTKNRPILMLAGLKDKPLAMIEAFVAHEAAFMIALSNSNFEGWVSTDLSEVLTGEKSPEEEARLIREAKYRSEITNKGLLKVAQHKLEADKMAVERLRVSGYSLRNYLAFLGYLTECKENYSDSVRKSAHLALMFTRIQCCKYLISKGDVDTGFYFGNFKSRFERLCDSVDRIKKNASDSHGGSMINRR